MAHFLDTDLPPTHPALHPLRVWARAFVEQHGPGARVRVAVEVVEGQEAQG